MIELVVPSSIEQPGQVIALINRAKEALQYIEEPREAATFVKQTDAIRYLAEKADATAEVQNQAAEVALRAKRRAGELLQEVLQHQGGRPLRSSLRSRSLENADQESTFPPLKELGIHQKASQRWQAIASIPEEKFENYLAEEQATGRELTTAGAVRLARELVEKETGTKPERWFWVPPESAGQDVYLIGPLSSEEAADRFAEEHEVPFDYTMQRALTPREWVEQEGDE